LHSLRSTSRGLIIPGSVLLGLGFVFTTVDIALAVEGLDWDDEPVRWMTAMSVLLGGVGLTLLSAGLALRKKRQDLYYGRVSAMPRINVGMFPHGQGAFLSATWSF
jgi:hypothetical protein